MENKVLEQNISRIAQYNKKLSDKILMMDIEKSNIQITQTEKGEYNLIYKNFLIHNDKSAEDEAKSIVQKINNKDEKNAIRIVYGLGLGYLADEMSKLNVPVVIYEPNIDILKFVLSIATIDAIFKDNVYVCSDSKNLQDLIYKLSDVDTKISTSFLSSYKTLFYDDILNITKVVAKSQGIHVAEKNTLISNSSSAINNTFQNLKNIYKNPNIEDIQDIYKNSNATALCVSAGPSLRENIEIIKKHQDKFVIFAVNPIVSYLVKSGIEPDFIVDIESFFTNKQFENINTKNYYFILEAFCDPKVSKLETRKTFNYISNINYINPLVRNCLGLTDNDLVKTYGTVSYTALMSAYLLGFRKIVLCGQDLAYKNGECYAQGSYRGMTKCVFDEADKSYKIVVADEEAFINSFANDNNYEQAKNLATSHLKFLNKNIYTVKGQDGNLIPTQTGYALFIDWFEKAAEKMKTLSPEIELINSSIGGAQINGYENIPISNVVESLNKVDKINLDNVQPRYDKTSVCKKIDVMISKIKILLQYIEEYEGITRKIKNEITLKKVITTNVQKLAKRFNDAFIKTVSLRKSFAYRYVYIKDFYNLGEIVKQENFEDVKSIIDTMDKVISAIETLKQEANKHIEMLTDCQSVILK